MLYVKKITGYREGQPVYREIEYRDWCGSYGHAIKTTNGKTTIGCIWDENGEPGCKGK